MFTGPAVRGGLQLSDFSKNPNNGRIGGDPPPPPPPSTIKTEHGPPVRVKRHRQ